MHKLDKRKFKPITIIKTVTDENESLLSSQINRLMKNISREEEEAETISHA